MDPQLSITLENKVHLILECKVSLRKSNLTMEDRTYTQKTLEQCLADLKDFVNQHPELNHHPALLKLPTNLSTFLVDVSTGYE